jgi:iron complex transport system ATP-binding protein
VDAALAAAGLTGLRHRPVETLSGGQQQRVWLAQALAQQTATLLLDEPTTFLDVAHQIEVFELVRQLNRAEGRTVVLVLHDLGLAARYADHVVALQAGRIVAAGAPGVVITESLVRSVFGLACCVLPDPRTGAPLVLPAGDFPPPSN